MLDNKRTKESWIVQWVGSIQSMNELISLGFVVVVIKNNLGFVEEAPD